MGIWVHVHPWLWKSFEKLTFKKLFKAERYTYTRVLEKFLKSWGKMRTRGIFWKFIYLKIMNGQIIRIVRQFSRTAYFNMIKCNICACIHMIDKRRWLYTENAGQEIFFEFSDNLRMFQGKIKRQISENVYIIEGKIQAGCQDVF